jgi:hypothetical protein
MNTKQTNRMAMFKTVAAYLDDHNTVWNGMAPMATAVLAFKGKISAADTAVEQQETPTGATDAKATARNDLEDVLFLACQALAVLGHTNNDLDLLAVAEVSRSDLDKLPDDELLTRANVIIAQANTRKPALLTLQVTEDNLTELGEKFQSFSELKGEPRTAAVERSAQTQSLESLMRDANTILRDQIDRMVDLFSRTNPNFVAGYKGARVVVDRAATHKTKPAGSTPPPANQ